MKIIIVHGDDVQKSYERLMVFYESARQRNWEIKSIDESDISIPEALSSNSLFSEERFFILKDIKLLNDKNIEWINKNLDNLELNFVIYSDKVLPVTFTKKFKKVHKVEEYKLPKLLFKFLDSITPGNSKVSLNLFQEIKTSEAPELVFSLIAKQFRDLYWVKTDESTIPYPSWRVGKLKSLASRFDENRLKAIINNLSEMDFKAKTGQANLADELDLMLLTKLE